MPKEQTPFTLAAYEEQLKIQYVPILTFYHPNLTGGQNVPMIEQYHLLSEKKKNIPQIICYVTKYGHILSTGNALELLTLSSNKRRHSMEALACL
jgi:hypothetical protein